jgi:hypothetical protein
MVNNTTRCITVRSSEGIAWFIVFGNFLGCSEGGAWVGGSYRSAMGGIIKRHKDAGEFVDMVGLEGIHKHSPRHLGVRMVVVARWRLGEELLLGVGAMVMGVR